MKPCARRPAGHWATLRESGFVLGMRIMLWAFRHGGQRLFGVLLVPVATWYALSRRSAVRASRDYLRRVGMPAGWGMAWRHIHSFACCLLDKLRAWSGDFPARSLREAGPQPFAALLGAGRGGLILVAHLGNLDACRYFAAQAFGRRLHVLVHTRHAQRFNSLMREINPHSAIDLLQVTALDAGAAMRLSAAVAAGDFVVIAGDRVPVGERGRTVSASFLGAPARFPLGPWMLAHALGCPVYALACLRESDGFALHWAQLAERVQLPRARREAALRPWLTAYVGWLEALCRQAPLQWFNFYDFWQDGDAAPGEPSC